MRWLHIFAACAAVVTLTAGAEAKPRPRPGARLRVRATAYCQHGKTESGTKARTGIVAADPEVLPVGSVVRLDGLSDGLKGIYTVMDTGAAVKGAHIDIFVPDCARAVRFGEREVLVHVLRRGWNPKASAPKASAGRK